MTVVEFMYLFIEESKQKMILFDTERGENVFEGYFADLPEDYFLRYVSSIDNILPDSDTITINI